MCVEVCAVRGGVLPHDTRVLRGVPNPRGTEGQRQVSATGLFQRVWFLCSRGSRGLGLLGVGVVWCRMPREFYAEYLNREVQNDSVKGVRRNKSSGAVFGG